MVTQESCVNQGTGENFGRGGTGFDAQVSSSQVEESLLLSVAANNRMLE
jgi:hypothetical protein